MKWVHSMEGGKENRIVKKIHVYKIRARKEGKLSCGKPNETTEISWQRKIL